MPRRRSDLPHQGSLEGKAGHRAALATAQPAAACRTLQRVALGASGHLPRAGRSVAKPGERSIWKIYLCTPPRAVLRFLTSASMPMGHDRMRLKASRAMPAVLRSPPSCCRFCPTAGCGPRIGRCHWHLPSALAGIGARVIGLLKTRNSENEP